MFSVPPAEVSESADFWALYYPEANNRSLLKLRALKAQSEVPADSLLFLSPKNDESHAILEAQSESGNGRIKTVHPQFKAFSVQSGQFKRETVKLAQDTMLVIDGLPTREAGVSRLMLTYIENSNAQMLLIPEVLTSFSGDKIET